MAIPEARAIKNKKGNGDRRRKEQATALFVAVLLQRYLALGRYRTALATGVVRADLCCFGGDGFFKEARARRVHGTRPSATYVLPRGSHFPPLQFTQSRVDHVMGCHLNFPCEAVGSIAKESSHNITNVLNARPPPVVVTIFTTTSKSSVIST